MNEIIEACIKYNRKAWEGDADWKKIGKELGLSKDAVRGRYRRFVKSLNGSVQDYINQNGGISVLDESTVSPHEPFGTPYEQFIEATGIDTDYYEVEKGKVWGMSGNPGFSAVWRPRSLPTEEQVDALLDRLRTTPQKTHPRYTPIKGGYSAVFSIYDLHLDQLSFDGSGIEQTTQAYYRVLSELSSHVSNYPLEEIVLVVGHDMGNTDNPQNTTTAGTQQENSTTWRFGIDTQCELVVRAIYSLKTHKTKIKVIVVQGNHDVLRSYFIGKFIEGWYRNDSNVEVDNQHNPRKYHRFGDVALMFTHGSAESRQKLPLLFSTEGNHVFAGATWREILTGHLHGMRETFTMIEEDHGIITRILPSLVSADEWHTLKGYVGNNKLGNVDLYSKTGQVGRFFASV